MFVHASVDEGVIENAILAPQQAIIRDPKGNATAMVVDANNKVVVRKVITSTTSGDDYLISSGLQAGDRVIVEGTSKVNAGQVVKPVETQLGATTPAATQGAS
jgi:membrane fusion protein (multidrug efflux system)